ncbi:YppG family protein [Lederbergia graminis]|uniref:YppG family protein n=1 Tax=Lederbergia graminis TaxID=735518 RepID=A0ABW0LEG8_9BACI
MQHQFRQHVPMPTWMLYQQHYQSPYPPNHYPPSFPNIYGHQAMQSSYGYPTQTGRWNKTSQLFQNPLQPEESYLYEQYGNQPGNQHYYPKPNPFIKPKNNQFNSILQSFKTQDGSFDYNKVVNTAGQLMNIFNQVSGMAKGLGGLFKF